MRSVIRKIFINASPERVFDTLDDLTVSGMHMTRRSGMMMGSRLNLEYLSKHKKGPGTKYRWTGKMMGMKMDFTVEVTRWVRGIEKVWETIGDAKMIIYSWYQMTMFVSKQGPQSLAELSITYKKPKSWFARFVSFLFADWYCRWCLNTMLKDAKKFLENHLK